jgi:hypothetical protein
MVDDEDIPGDVNIYDAINEYGEEDLIGAPITDSEAAAACERNAMDLEDMVYEARERAKGIMGSDLFLQVYDLCLRHMKEEDNADDPTFAESAFIQELERTLYERMHEQNIEDVCSVVFSVKVLLALESRLRVLREKLKQYRK